MIGMDVLVAFAIAALVLSLSPGPSNLYIMACTIGNGARAGIAAAAGMALGSLSYAALTALGLSAVIVYSPALFIGLKVAGALYLLYLGAKTWLQATVPHLQNPVKTSTKKVLRQSLIVELTNPKTGLFFIAFLPQFTRSESGSISVQLLLLGGVYAVIALGSDLLVVTLSSKLGRWLARSPDWAVRQEKLAGIILFALGVFILLEESGLA